MMSLKLILASSSPRRKKLLESLGCCVEVVPSEIKENIDSSLTPSENVARLASLKALSVGKKIKKGIVIAADTVVVLEGKIFGKPKDKKEARKMLESLSGKEHQVITGLAIFVPAQNRLLKQTMETKIKFCRLDKETIKKYLEVGEYCDKAGAYAIQGKGVLLVESINGDYYNVVGLPLCALNKLLKKLGISLL